jgi:branched-chain amino acid transport system permease protein
MAKQSITELLLSRSGRAPSGKARSQGPKPALDRRLKLGCAAAAAAFLLAFPFLPFVNAYWVDVGFLVGIYALLGLSLNIVLGEVGLFDLGHAAFYAIGAYATAILNTRFHVPIAILIPVSVLASAAFAYLVTTPIIHLRGDYLCIVTIGIGEIVRLVAERDPGGMTHGPNGITGVANPDFGLFRISGSTPFYYYVAAIIGLVILGLLSLQKSRVGRAWNYIREDETAAEAMGVDVRSFKRLAFVLGAALAGLAGNVYASKFMVVSPSTFTFMDSTLLFCIVLIGGLGSIPGTILGAAAIVLFPELFREFAKYRMLLFGAALVAMMIFRPSGLWPRRRSGLPFRSLGIRVPGTRDEDLIEGYAPEPVARDARPDRRHPRQRGGELLEVRELSLRFGGLTALDDLSLDVRKGQITSIIGPNGAGKTTLFNVVTGIYKPSSGHVSFMGKVISGLKPHSVIEAGIARTFQNIRLFKSLTCIENALCGPHCHARSGLLAGTFRPPRQRREELESLKAAAYRLKQVGLWEDRNELASSLPYGRQRLLEIARAMASGPELLILDEPSSGLNDRESEELVVLLRKLAAEGVTLLLIEHDMNVVMGISDRVIVLAEGRLIADGEPKAVYEDPAVVAAYLGED